MILRYYDRMKPALQIITTPLPDALEKWRGLYIDELKEVNNVIIQLSEESKVPLIGEVARHIIASGGKRLRPILTIISSKLCGYEGDLHIKLAAAIEFIHTATLLHDDVVDKSELRRGRKTANECWGNEASVLVGDFLLSRAFQIMARSENLKILRILSDASATISEGEVNQLVAQNNIETTSQNYFDIISAKTAKLFSAGCEIGPVITKRQENEESALANYGQYLGIAFQIVDDVLDYSSHQEKLGKTIGDDFHEGKVTLPIILAYTKANDEEKDFWKRTIEDSEQKDGDLEFAINLMKKYGVLDEAMQTAREYAEKGAKTLKLFANCDEKQALLDFLDFAVNRPY